jgi:hypothetical protein
MVTYWRTQRAEEDLYDEQLLDRMDRLDTEAARIESYQSGEMRLQATKAQVRYAPTLKNYFRNLKGIARESLQLTIIDDLKAVPTKERKEIVKSWWEETNERSLKYRKVRNFVLQESTEEAKEEIVRIRSLIAPELTDIANGLSEFKFGSEDEFWPFQGSDGQDMKPIAVTSLDVVDEHGSSEGIGLIAGVAQPIQKKRESDFVNLLAGVIYGLVAERLRPTWENVSKRIQVGQVGEAKEDKTDLFPADFQERIAARQFAGNLYDFLTKEDEAQKADDEQIEEKEPPSDPTVEPIDFILRFQRSLSKALAVTGQGKKRPRKPKK